MLIYDVLHKERVYHAVAGDLRGLGVKYRFKKSMLKSERPEVSKDISKRVFKTPLFYQALDIVGLSSGAIVHVPVFVIQATKFLEEHVAQEGLFRKAGSQARQRELMSRLDSGGGIGDKNHAVDIANCLKSFFRDLPEPLIPYAYHDLFVHCALLKSHRVQALLLACTLLPPYHLNTLAYLMEFLKKVSMCEKQNKMGVENLAKVIGPNIMPLQEATMSAVQNRLQMYLTIVKILIENSESIGVLPSHIAQCVSTEIASGSTDCGLDSFELHRKHKKKKHRSGSLTRMFNGLKKMVGKGTDDISNINHPQSLVHSTHLNMASNRYTKKRKVIEREHPPGIKKKKLTDKLDKSKKLRLSLDKFVPKNKQKNIDGNLSDSYTGNYKLCNERRWSSANDSFDTHKICEYSDGISDLRLMKSNEPSNNDSRQEYNNVFINTTVDLSDDSGERDLLINKNRRNNEQWRMNVSTNSRKLDTTDESDNICLLTPEEKTDSEEFDTFLPSNMMSSSSNHCEEDYVRIPKSEYEDIKNRVSAIESRISQEFGCIYNEKTDITTQSLNNIQTAYEKTLEEASIKNTLTSDYLAKRLSKELKIRRSGEHKIIRSPSARKIGSLRRRSQEKVTSKRVRRTASWHTSPEFNLQHDIQLEGQVNIYPIKKQSIYSSKYLEEQSHSIEKCNGNISNVRDEIACLHNQINTLISRSNVQHEISNNSDLDLSGFKDLHLNNKRTTTSVRRASSFHGKDFVDNSSYFDKKIDDLKKASSHQNIAFNNDCLERDKTVFEGSNTISWKDADKYFKSVSRTNTPAPQTGRASVARLRMQNAGMVLAKARLFDEGTTKTSDFILSNVSNRKHCRDNVTKHSSNISQEMNVEHFTQACNKTQVSRRKSNRDLKSKNRHTVSSPNASSQIKTQVTDTSLKSFQKGLNEHYRFTLSRKFELQNQNLLNKNATISQTFTKDKGIEVHNTKIHQKENVAAKESSLTKMPASATLNNPNISPCKSDVSKTPHIKRPLTIKTPKSSKLVRRPPVDTRRTPLKATAHLGTPKRQSPKSILKTRALSMYM